MGILLLAHLDLFSASETKFTALERHLIERNFQHFMLLLGTKLKDSMLLDQC
jgi:hypothetical protein